jgi:hypothetical protein
LCFRTDGTLARVRQAQTVPGLDQASAVRAYYYTTGKMAISFGVYAKNDPAVAATIASLPYYNVLPQ